MLSLVIPKGSLEKQVLDLFSATLMGAKNRPLIDTGEIKRLTPTLLLGLGLRAIEATNKKFTLGCRKHLPTPTLFIVADHATAFCSPL